MHYVKAVAMRVKVPPGPFKKGFIMPKHTKHNPDYTKDRTADIIKKGTDSAIPQEYYQTNHNLTPSQMNDGLGAFNPKRSKDRPQVYVKTNECDN